jgi:dihydroxyacetone kinase-like protein
MNFDMAKDMAEMADIQVDFVIVDDDIAVENSTYTQGKRGVAGTVLVHKILGNLARSGASLVAIKKAAEVLVQNSHNSCCTFWCDGTKVGRPGFELPEDEIEYGVGIHGEPGYRREKMLPSKDLAKELVDKLVLSFDGDTTSHYAILVNGMGATPLMEQFIFTNDVMDLLDDKGVKVTYSKVGNLMTSIDMAGISLTLLRLSNADWLEGLNADVKTIAWG